MYTKSAIDWMSSFTLKVEKTLISYPIVHL